MNLQPKTLVPSGTSDLGVGMNVSLFISPSNSSFLDCWNYRAATDFLLGVVLFICLLLASNASVTVSDAVGWSSDGRKGFTHVERKMLHPVFVCITTVSPAILMKLCGPSHLLFVVR